MKNAPVTSIKGIGPRRAEALGKLGLSSVLDLVRFAPRDYLDYTADTSIAAAEHGAMAAVRVSITGPARQVRVHRGFTMTVARAFDGADKLDLVWYNQPYRAAFVKEGESVFACGRVDKTKGKRLLNPALYDQLPGIVPVYPLCAGLNQRVLRDAVAAALEYARGTIEETLPPALCAKYGLLPLEEAFFTLHNPPSPDTLLAARERLAFEDMLLFSLMLSMLRRERESHGGVPFRMDGVLERFLRRLPFAPTKAQLRAMGEIAADMAAPRQMNRLLQGDVGSGKTACALFAMFAAMENGRTACLMAPTEILARQHYATLSAMFGERALLLTGGMKKKERDAALSRLASGEALAVTGTHALLTGDVNLGSLGLVIADEQHRFGVRQRAAIGAKGEKPDTLIMSATPIPRTLSLILYGDLDVSVIDELPPGRKPITTRLVPREKRKDMYKFIQRQLEAGRQAYVVCPLVDASEALEGVTNVTGLFRELPTLLNARAELLHGRLSSAEKEAVTTRFRTGETQLLVSTTVVEVGVDVPNASVMVIENADRFGLAQLHQLRGRVGRGAAESFCFLLGESDGKTARERLGVLVKTGDGFEIAERDLALRGPGEFMGRRQHGAAETGAVGLNMAGLAANMHTLNMAREAAEALLADGDADNPLMLRAKALFDEKTREIAQN